DILWRFEDSIIAQFNGDKISYPHLTERFGDRLQLDHQNGSLTIKNTRINDTGLYKLEISHNSGNLLMTFSVSVSDPGLSSGAKAGIVVVLLLVFAVAAAGVFYYRHCAVVTDEDKTVSVKEGESVTLNTDAEIQKDDQIIWMFGPQENLIAEIKGETREISTYDVAGGRFRDRLKLDKKTGSLTITNTTAEHIGVYKLQSIGSRGTLYQRFILTVKIAYISVVEGEPVTLYPDTEIQKDDQIWWMFGDEKNLIAQMKGKTRETHEGTDGRFRDRLKLDKRTGSLTINRTLTEHSGLYKLQISSKRRTTNKRFKVAINLKKVSAKEGESVTLEFNAVIRKKDELLWLFGDENTRIAEIKAGIGKISTIDVADGRFRDRLQLDKNTGSMTIRNITTEHAGVYTLWVISSKLNNKQRCNVTVRDVTVLKTIGMRGKDVTLNPDTEVQRDDLILWMFGDQDNLIAQLTGETGETTYADADERFRDKLRLNKNTGSLTISNITSGPYNLQIISSKRTSYRNFRVFNSCESFHFLLRKFY
ncbi:hypothetical protein PO909_028006, partial [Leuciscus waleckii]